MPSIQESLARYNRVLFRYMLPGSLVFSVIPLYETLYLGNNGNLLLAPIAPLILLIASGLVCVSWWILAGLLSVIGRGSSVLFRRSVFVCLINMIWPLTCALSQVEEKPWVSPGAQLFH